jgi:hypothetical protein
VVGGLVEYQEVGCGEHHFGQHAPDLFPS